MNYILSDQALFDRLIAGLDKQTQMDLSLQYSHYCLTKELEHRREIEQLKKEITEEVLSRVAATMDVSDCLQKIDELRRALDNLGK